MSGNNFVLLSLGANIGRKKETIGLAASCLVSGGIIVEPKISSFYLTEPVGFAEQAWFVNAAISGYTRLSPNELIFILKSIEYFLGRRARQKWCEREIDIDLLLYGEEISNCEMLALPHPEMHLRRFVLVPAAEIASNAVHPVFRRTIGQLLESCEDKSSVLPEK